MGLIGVVACSGEEAPPREEVPIPLDTLCAEVARADCNRLNGCGLLAPPFDLSLCQLRQEQVLCAPIAAALRGAVDAGSLTYFELAARDCRDAVASIECSVGLEHDLLELPECRAMITSDGDEDDPCHLGLACKEGLYCVAEDGCPGRCRAYRQNNETCTSGGELCAPDLFCSVTGMRCRARVDLGGACELSLDNNSCRDGGWCDRTNPADMRCRTVKGRGTGCNSSFECGSGARCVSNRCSAGEEGDTCVEDADCRNGLDCDAGACAVPLQLDAPCMPDGTACAEGLVCTSTQSGVCGRRPTAGNACDEGECYLSSCEDGTCAPAVFPEEACSASSECFPGHTCADGICKVEPIACNE